METRDRAVHAQPRMAAVAWRRALLGALLVLALVVRMREPFSSPVIGAEDSYLHMAKTWDIVQGRGLPQNYPPGFPLLLVPFAILGPEAFYAAARFLPPLLGVVQVLGVFLLAREHLRTPAAFVAATAVALMPENVFRTNLLFPTALDLALLPFFLLFLLRAANKDRRALAAGAQRRGRGRILGNSSIAWAIGIALILAVCHPWVLVYMLPPTFVVALRAFHRPRDRIIALGVLGALALAGLLFAFIPGTWNPAPSFLQNAGPRAWELVTHPSSLFPLPRYVDSFWWMVTPSVIALSIVGVAVALVRRTTLGLVALAYSVAIVPFVFVDWFDVWFIPHRSVAYLSLGMALLAALPIELMGALPEWDRADVAAAAVVGVYLLLALTPAALAVQPWYRLYEEDDQDAWRAIGERDPSLVVTGSWQAAVGYRATTGENALFDSGFFRSADERERILDLHPDVIVLVEKHAREDGIKVPSGFREIGRWGDSVAYVQR